MALTREEVLAASDALVAAFAATDTAAYFDCFSPDATFVFHPEPVRLDDRAAYENLNKSTGLSVSANTTPCSST